jgi:hypothetical protein
MTEVTIVEATGRAGGSGPELGNLLSTAQIAAQVALNELGIADDTPNARLREILGDNYALHLGPNDDAETAVGADIIRTAKNRARVRAKERYDAGVREAQEAAELHAKHEAGSEGA